ncbi:hypothetical protein DXG01_003406 [Tephrocybe rancida]|nr:hypothetical protein DXG01_003406 [Tephrocybe rancida]
MATILYDEDSSHLTWRGSWTVRSDSVYLGGSAAGNENSEDLALSVTFSGKLYIRTSMVVYGVGTLLIVAENTSEADAATSKVVIDGIVQPRTNFWNENCLDVLYRSPVLPEATHNITFSEFPLMNIDYILINAGQNTPLSGERLMVDESDSSIVFNGAWTRNTSILNDSSGQSRYAFNNATRQTISRGATATFSFSGTSVSVFGISVVPRSLLVLNYTLDGQPRQKHYQSFTTSPGPFTNFLWFSWSNLSPSAHTLTMTVDFVDGGAIFTIDYLIYTPSFASLAEKPGADVTSQSPNTVSQDQPTSSNVSPQANVTPPLPKHDLSRGALVGAVVGPALFVSPFPLPPIRADGPVELRIHRKPGTLGVQESYPGTSGQYLSADIPDPSPMGASPIGLMQSPATHGRASRWTQLLRRTAPGTIDAFPLSPFSPPVQSPPSVQRKLALNGSAPLPQRPTSQDSDAASANDTIVADPQVQELEELVLELQRELREQAEARDGVPMREMVESRWPGNDLERERRGVGDGGSVAMSSTVAS